MAELTITLRRATEPGELDIRVGFRSDADALPYEHEADHRHWVMKLFPDAEVSRERPMVEAAVG